MLSSLGRRFDAFRHERALARMDPPVGQDFTSLNGLLPKHWSLLGERAQRAYTLELSREISPPHPLAVYLISLWAVASCDGNDDTLFWDSSKSDRFFLVHLTWRGRPDRFPDQYLSSLALSRKDLPEALDR